VELKDIHNVYFLGIGGIGMSALARWFNANGFVVAGYDKTPTALTASLEKEGIVIHFEDDMNAVSGDFKNRETTLVVYTPAVSENHSELVFFQGNGFQVKKRAEVLGLLTRKYFTIAVAGTHGKTTTSSMVAHVLHHSGVNTMAFVGGISQNYNSNLILNDKNRESPIVVVEADEFDRSFLQLSPNLAIVTTVDPDHLDIYENQADFEQTFRDFIDKIPADGSLVYNKKACTISLDEIVASQRSYGLSEGDIQAKNIKVVNGEQVFDYVGEQIIESLQLALPGMHNIQNMLSAISVCLEVGVSAEKIEEAVKAYRGVKRRFEYVIKSEEIIYVDDYAHHPAELEALLESIRYLFPEKKITLVFQPHLFSRTNDFMNDFAQVLGKVDDLYLLDIYPARELPIEGVSSEVLFNKIKSSSKTLTTKDKLMSDLANIEPEIMVTAGAGDIDGFIQPIKEMLNKLVLTK
jgi:UDP-N-acetylmuramate--alanine ligase